MPCSLRTWVTFLAEVPPDEGVGDLLLDERPSPAVIGWRAGEDSNPRPSDPKNEARGPASSAGIHPEFGIQLMSPWASARDVLRVWAWLSAWLSASARPLGRAGGPVRENRWFLACL